MPSSPLPLALGFLAQTWRLAWALWLPAGKGKGSWRVPRRPRIDRLTNGLEPGWTFGPAPKLHATRRNSGSNSNPIIDPCYTRLSFKESVDCGSKRGKAGKSTPPFPQNIKLPWLKNMYQNGTEKLRGPSSLTPKAVPTQPHSSRASSMSYPVGDGLENPTTPQSKTRKDSAEAQRA